MRGVLDAVEKRIAEHHIGMGHIDLRPEDLLAVGIFAVPHLPEKLQVLLHAAVPPGALDTGLVNCSPAFGNLFLALVVNVCEASLYELFGPLVKLVEIVGCIALLLPLETHPAYIFLNRVHILDILLDRIGVVIAEIGLSAILGGESEIDAQALGVAEVQIAVGFGRETGQNRIHFSAFEVFFNDFLKEIQLSLFFHNALYSTVSVQIDISNFQK